VKFRILAIFPTLSSEMRRVSSDERGFRRAALMVFLLTLFVILFGAVVRITGSGAGCGQHWPSCNGEVAHLPRSLETGIELTHRVTSGLALLGVVLVVVLSFRAFPAGHLVRRASAWALVFMLVEALIGAALVLFALVAEDTSLGRALVMPAHLVSTYALTGALFLALAREPSPPPVRIEGAWRLCWLGAAVLVVISGTGALTALGDTLYPPGAADIATRLAEDHGVSSTFLQKLRVLHPVLAVLGGALMVALSATLARRSGSPTAARAARGVTLTVVAQLVAGVVNVLLSAPGWMQVLHLALALGVWLSFVRLANQVLDLGGARG
jgi:cytochrome c oxidase assembly protein subunit 15